MLVSRNEIVVFNKCLNVAPDIQTIFLSNEPIGLNAVRIKIGATEVVVSSAALLAAVENCRNCERV